MAEGFCRKYWDKNFMVYSAGIKKHGMNPWAIKVMREVGVDLDLQYSKTIEELPKIKFEFVVTVCDSAKESCPYLPAGKTLHLGFDDPPTLAQNLSSEKEILDVYRRVRDEIDVKIRLLPEILRSNLN
jgi:arsenate reductase